MVCLTLSTWYMIMVPMIHIMNLTYQPILWIMAWTLDWKHFMYILFQPSLDSIAWMMTIHLSMRMMSPLALYHFLILHMHIHALHLMSSALIHPQLMKWNPQWLIHPLISHSHLMSPNVVLRVTPPMIMRIPHVTLFLPTWTLMIHLIHGSHHLIKMTWTPPMNLLLILH